MEVSGPVKVLYSLAFGTQGNLLLLLVLLFGIWSVVGSSRLLSGTDGVDDWWDVVV